jgi:holo-[acyl-carrier protein] synthase
MIGLGNDIVEVARIEKILNKSHSDTFKNRVFTENEQLYCEKMANSSPHYAARWALKEAFYKALPEELQQYSGWLSIELDREENQKPQVLVLSTELKEKMDEFGITSIFHSISHEKKYCSAVVAFS